MDSVYCLDKSDVIDKILAIAEINNTVIENRQVILKALDLYEEKNIDFKEKIIP